MSDAPNQANGELAELLDRQRKERCGKSFLCPHGFWPMFCRCCAPYFWDSHDRL